MFAAIIGDDEAAVGEVSLKPLREAGDEQKRVKVDDLGDAIMNSMLDWDEEEEA
jgi:histidyl-tRNA synthetase